MASTTYDRQPCEGDDSQSGRKCSFSQLSPCGFCQDDNPTVNFSANIITAATMQEIVANTRSAARYWRSQVQ
jgi:hypothetical protein